MTKLSDVSTLITKGTTPTTIGGKFVDKGVNFIKVESITDDGGIDCNKLAHIDEKTHQKLARSQIKQGDVLLSIAGDIGRCAVADTSVIPANTNQAVAIIRLFEDILLPDYLKYHFRLESSRRALLLANAQSIQSNVNLKNVGDYEMSIPNIDVQRKIISQLSAIDEFILINKKIIETSKKLMREIYDYWFVQFNYPDENGRPYKSSGGEMIYNETLKREIPKGWKATELGNLAKNRTESTVGTHDDKCIDLSIMPSGSIILDKYNFGDSFDSNMKSMKKGDVLFGSIRPYLRKAGIAPYEGVRAGTVHCFYAKNTIDSSMCSVMMTSEDMFQYAVMKSGGSTRMPSVSAKDILSYSFAYNQEISSKYNDICSDLINQIILLINENISLASLRDWLLPMLMNGQIKVSD